MSDVVVLVYTGGGITGLVSAHLIPENQLKRILMIGVERGTKNE